jgi:putative drug exporter of the RND superfamily
MRVKRVSIGICLVTYLMLVPILRSLLLPAIALVLNLITVGMAFGILVLLFAVGDEPLLGGAGSLDVIAVAAIFAITFALAIDYQVFLLTRMREEFVRTQSNDAAIEFGISKTAAIVTGAALIMIAVFSAFALARFVTIKMFGVGLATAVLIDATLIRLVLLPALMRLFGLNTWWIPNWLDERLPLIDTTGAEFEHEQEQMTPSPAGA